MFRMLFSCNQSLVKSKHVVSAATLTAQPQSRHHPDITSSSTFFQNSWLPSRWLDNLLHHSLPLTSFHLPHPSLLIPIPLFCVVCFICIFLPLAIGGSSRVEVEILLLRAGTPHRHRYRGAPAGSSNSTERQPRNGAPTSGEGAPPTATGAAGRQQAQRRVHDAATEASTAEGPGPDDSPPRPVRPWRGRVI